ncbi:NrfD/PsrC family molybdoenzyme membrane anchor subunit [Vulcanisaeta thermophila]|uniref:NrfD/PsrC family molybdoenzyme membrane anchor subunit n=1 Tax=Vulcanisaeta thermophila TaxID=867917 RepID=UPI000853628A|nr:NrfD/PsrC family molybdoenzyme membrane anchor subunit [Vulcanisaeta thermophila]
MSSPWPVTWTGWGPYMPPGYHLIWGWRIAAAVFLTALGSMAMLLAAFYDLRLKASRMVKINITAGWVFILAALAFFIIDLGRPERAGNIIFIGYPAGRLAQSWMAWGVLFLSGMVIWGIIYLAFLYLPSLVTSIFKTRVRTARMVLDYLVILTGIAATVYTAFLFTAAGGKSYWWNGALPILWLSSGISYGAAWSLLIARFFEIPRTSVKTDGGVVVSVEEVRGVIHELGWVDLLGVVFEGFSWALFISAALANHYLSSLSLYELLFGDYAGYFWGFVISLGIAIPLLLEIVMLRVDPIGAFTRYAIPIIFIAVMVGGFTLRYVVIATAYFHVPIPPFYNTTPQWGPWWG